MDFEESDFFEDSEFETIVVKDDDGSEIELSVIDMLETAGLRYLLCVESQFVDSDEPEAYILKELYEEGGDVIYATVEEDGEFNAVSALFKSSGASYDLEL